VQLDTSQPRGRMVGLRQTAFRRPRASLGLRRPLYPPGGHFQSSQRARSHSYKDYHHDARHKTMILEAQEFIRRFLLHVLPDGFQRIRYYGFSGNRYREQKLAHCRKLLGMPTPAPPALAIAKDYRERYEELTGSSLWQCPVCRQGRMLVTQIFPRSPPRHVSITDTSVRCRK
jgi:Putative transposase